MIEMFVLILQEGAMFHTSLLTFCLALVSANDFHAADVQHYPLSLFAMDG